MSDQFKLEDKIMQAWQVVEDINLLLRMHCDKDVTDDQVQNFLLGMTTIYQARFEELFETFEDYLRSKKGSALSAAHVIDCTDEQLIEEVRRRGFVIRDAQIGREWVGLTEAEIYELMDNEDEFDFARAIEAKLKEKNT